MILMRFVFRQNVIFAAKLKVLAMQKAIKHHQM